MNESVSSRDIRKLSCYLDGDLSEAECARLESRLAVEPNLRRTLDDLRQTREVLRSIPQRRVPRNFTLSPHMTGLRAPTPRALPALRLTAVFTTVLFVFSYAVNMMLPLAASPLAAAPAGVERAPQEVEALAVEQDLGSVDPDAVEEDQAPAYAVEATPAAEMGEGDAVEKVPNMRAQDDHPVKTDTLQEGPAETAPQLIPLAWQIVLLTIAIICAIAALVVHWNSRRRFNRKLIKNR